MWQMTMAKADYDELREHLLRSQDEAAAVLICGWVDAPGRQSILVREVRPVPPNGIEYVHGAAVSIRTEWLAAVLKEVAAAGLTLTIAHSHPFSADAVRFSSIDDNGHRLLVPALQRRIPGRPLCELVFGQGSVDGLVWEAGSLDASPLLRIVTVGSAVEWIETTRSAPSSAPETETDGRYDRQVMIWGSLGQRRLSELRIGVVGAGGNGSWVCVQLIHLGVGELVVVDPDVVESSNRARLVGSTPADAEAATPKVDVVARYAQVHNPGIKITPMQLDVHNKDAIERLKTCDILIGCTDTLTSRDMMNRLAGQYVIPFIDTGAEVELEGQRLRTFAVRCTPVLPGGPCLACDGFISGEAIISEARQSRPGYIPGVPAASVAPLNVLASALACLDALRLIHGLLGGLSAAAFSAYSGRSGELRRCGLGTAGCAQCRDVAARGDARQVDRETER
jgi:hypothetical protein